MVKSLPVSDRTFNVIGAKTLVDLAIISLLWGLAVLVTNPVGEFPLNDDWSYTFAAKRLAEGQGYDPTSWNEMNLFTHAAWGALFCLPNGFSFTALRISTLVLSLLGALAMYGLIRQLQRPRVLALIGALTLAFNPLYFALSHTFMTDVPFTTWAILAAWFYLRHLQQEKPSDLLIATAFAVFATLSRQIGMCLPVGFGIALLLLRGWNVRAIIRASIPLLTCLLAHIVFRLWLRMADKTPPDSNMHARLWIALTHPLRWPVNVVYYGWNMLMYLGWFLLPLTLPAMFQRPWAAKHLLRLGWEQIAAGIFLVVCVIRFVLMPGLMPVHNNIITPQGIGPALLRDTFVLNLAHQAALPKWFWLGITTLSIVGGLLLVAHLATVVKRTIPALRFRQLPPDQVFVSFFLLVAAAYLAPFLLCGFFDRYLVPVAALLILALSARHEPPEPGGRRRWVVFGLIALSGGFALAATRDYLEWNRTRWHAVDSFLTQTGIRPEELDGGFEFNSWHVFAQTNRPARWNNSPAYAEWFETVPYVVAFGPIEGFETVHRFPYRTWLPPREPEIVVLKRKGEN